MTNDVIYIFQAVIRMKRVIFGTNWRTLTSQTTKVVDTINDNNYKIYWFLSFFSSESEGDDEEETTAFKEVVLNFADFEKRWVDLNEESGFIDFKRFVST